MLGVGLDARIVAGVDSGIKRRLGKGAYVLAGVKQVLFTVPPNTIEIAGSTLTCGFILASRIKNYGGDFEIARTASIRNDSIEVVTFRGSNPLRYVAYFAGAAVRIAQHLPGVETHRLTSFRIVSESPLQADGEYLGVHSADVELVPGALHLLMPGER